MKKAIIQYKFGEPMMIKRNDGSYVDNYEEWHRYLISEKENKQ
jgi:hypothetical protein